LAAVLDRVDPRKQDVVVLHLRFLAPAGGGEYELDPEQLFSSEEQTLFTRALNLAEKKGKTIHLAVAGATEKWEAILKSAQSLKVSDIVLGSSPNRSIIEEARVAGLAWECLRGPRPQLTLQVCSSNGHQHVSYLGPHAPHLTAKEIDLLHGIWLDLSQQVAPQELHHHDIVHFALERLQLASGGDERERVIGEVREHLKRIVSARIAHG
jgi:hypothetical protein